MRPLAPSMIAPLDRAQKPTAENPPKRFFMQAIA
jgi:hypothetical protein